MYYNNYQRRRRRAYTPYYKTRGYARRYTSKKNYAPRKQVNNRGAKPRGRLHNLYPERVYSRAKPYYYAPAGTLEKQLELLKAIQPQSSRVARKEREMVEGPPTLLDNIARGAGAVGELARAILPMIEMINTEAKFYDHAHSQFISVTTPALLTISSPIVQGVTENDRIGNVILIQHVQLRVMLSLVGQTATPSTAYSAQVRIILFCWKDNADENAPQPTKLLQPGFPVTTAPLNKDFSDQFVVMKDKVSILHQNVPSTINGHISESIHWKAYKDVNWHAHWNTDSPAATTNHLYLCALTNMGDNHVHIQITTRLNYTDN